MLYDQLTIELERWLDSVGPIHQNNIGGIRRACFVPWDSKWNGIVRNVTAQREVFVEDAPATTTPPAGLMPKLDFVCQKCGVQQLAYGVCANCGANIQVLAPPAEVLGARESLNATCRRVWVCKRCGNCLGHCKHKDESNFHEDLAIAMPCSIRMSVASTPAEVLVSWEQRLLGQMVMLLLQKDYPSARELALTVSVEFPDGSPCALPPHGIKE